MTKKLDLYWKSNRDWWTFNFKDGYKLTSKAPEEAKRSFEQYKKDIQNPAL